MYIQYLYNDTWFKTKIPQTPFRLVIQKEWHCTGMSPPPIWRPTSQANPWSSKKNVKKGLAFSTKMRPKKGKWFIPTWTIRLPRTERGSLIAQGQCKEKENQRASYYFLQSVLFCQYLLFLEIHSIYLDICQSKLLPLVAGEIVLTDPIIVVKVRWQQVETKIV